jgi:radical SAM protein with 4Fe4S-binding SPASM domain
MNLRDSLHWVSKQTPARWANMARVTESYYRSRWRGTPAMRGLPISIAVEPTTSCNLRCPECPSGLRSFTRPTGMLPEQLFEKVVDQLAPTLSYLIFYFQGEPYLHPQFLHLVRYATSRNIYTATSTNAHYLSDAQAELTVRSGLSRLIISIDGTSQDTYQSYRVGGSLEKVIAGTKNILAWKKRLNSATPHVMFQFLVVRPNEHQVPEVLKLGKTLGVNEVVLKTAQIYDYQNGSPLMPTQERYSRYRQNADGTYRIKNSFDNHCWKMWHSCVITWDGNVVPCCFDKDAHHVLGNVSADSFENIWRSSRYDEFRASLMKSRSSIEMCKNCTEGTQVWA